MTKRAIVYTLAGGLASAEIDRQSVSSVVLGQCFLVTAEMDFGPYGQLFAGDTGVVVYTNQVSGEVQIKVDRYISAMSPWENTFTLMPFETDDMLICLQPVLRQRSRPQLVHVRLRLR